VERVAQRAEPPPPLLARLRKGGRLAGTAGEAALDVVFLVVVFVGIFCRASWLVGLPLTGIVLMQKFERTMDVVKRVREAVARMNADGTLPPGVHIDPSTTAATLSPSPCGRS
jgi:hypothetical protein